MIAAASKPARRSSGMLMLGASMVGVVLLLTGCASNRTNVPREARIVTSSESVILPPPGGPSILKVVTTDFSNAVKQDVWLETNARSIGENKISVIRFTGKGGDGSDDRLVDTPFTHVNLTAEALAAWPNSGMAVSPYYVQNDYGPFGYAIAKPANGDTCIYAWQRIEAIPTPSGADVERGAIVTRLQMCRQNASEQSLLEVMYNLRLNTAVFPPNKAPALIGRSSAPIRPIGVEGFADVIAVQKPAPVTTPRAVTPSRPVVPTIPAGAPIVPSPGGTGGGSAIVPSPSSGIGTGTGSGSGPTVPRPPSTGT